MHIHSFSSLFAILLSEVGAGVLRTRSIEGEQFSEDTYLVKFNEDVSAGFRENHTAWVRSLEQTDANGKESRGLRHEFSLAFQGYSAVLDDQTVRQIQSLPGIAEVKPVGLSPPSNYKLEWEKTDELEHASQSRIALNITDIAADVTTEQQKGWNANRISHRKFQQSGYNDGPWVHDGFLGQGVTIYVLDTGITLENPGFKGSDVSHGKVFAKLTKEGDKNGHGTMCSGVIAGEKHGLSPKAKMVDVKVANDQDLSFCDDVVAGIEWVVAQPGENHMKVISMSQTGFTGKPDVSTAVAAAVKKGVHVVVCAGNFDVDACSVQPGNAPGVVSVGSIEPTNKTPTKLTSPEGTNLGKCVTVFAPGSRVPTLSHKNLSPTYKYFGWGTSIAAPQVAALIANRLSKVGPQPPAKIVQWLQGTATKDQIQGNLKGAPNLIAFSGVGEPDAA